MKAITVAKTKQKSAYCNLCRSIFPLERDASPLFVALGSSDPLKDVTADWKKLRPMTTMLLVMVDIAKRDEVFGSVFSLVYVVLYVMKFKHLSGIFRRKH